MILDAKVLMRDRCFISFLNDRTSLLCERSGPRPGVGQDRGRDNCGENTGMRHAIIHCAGRRCKTANRPSRRSAGARGVLGNARTSGHPPHMVFQTGDQHSQMAEIAIVVAVAQSCLKIAQVSQHRPQ
jgi:hypothetical protein